MIDRSGIEPSSGELTATGTTIANTGASPAEAVDQNQQRPTDAAVQGWNAHRGEDASGQEIDNNLGDNAPRLNRPNKVLQWVLPIWQRIFRGPEKEQ